MLTLQKSPPVPVSPPTVYKQQQPVPNNIINQNPFNTQQTSTGNPFGDNFSNMNDNDLFGLEFDRIRQNTNLENNQGKLLTKKRFNKLEHKECFNEFNLIRRSASVIRK